MRSTIPLTFMALAALACGGGDTDPDDLPADGTDPAAETGPVGEDPGLPTEETEFRGTTWSTEAGASEIGGRLWVSRATTVETDGFSLIAQVEALPEGSYSWAFHRGDCTVPDEPLFDLGYGGVAGQDADEGIVGEGADEARDTPRIFRSGPGATAQHTVFVPLGEGLSRQELTGAQHSVRLHPNVSGDDPGPSVACAPVPPLPQGGGAGGAV